MAPTLGKTIDNKTLAIPLLRGGVAIVDVECAPLLAGRRWRIASHGYAVAGGGNARVYMHRIVTGAAPGTEIDHVNGDRLDNRRANLRPCRHVDNQKNRHHRGWGSSSFRGVSWCRRKRRWRATVGVDGRHVHVGYFRLEIDAARARDEAAARLHGQQRRRGRVGRPRRLPHEAA